MKNPFLHIAILFLLVAYFTNAQTPKPKRVNPMAPIEEVKGLPHVLIIGDSISIGYTFPPENCLRER